MGAPIFLALHAQGCARLRPERPGAEDRGCAGFMAGVGPAAAPAQLAAAAARRDDTLARAARLIADSPGRFLYDGELCWPGARGRRRAGAGWRRRGVAAAPLPRSPGAAAGMDGVACGHHLISLIF